MAIHDQNVLSPTTSFDIGDIYYTLFRHKWKIVFCSIAGLLASFQFYRSVPASYYSEAKLYIRYVVTGEKSLSPSPDATTTPDQGGDTIMNSEREILLSLDLAEQVAKSIGPEKILAKAGGGRDLGAAAMLIQGNLFVDAPARSSVIRVVFKHPDPSIVQIVLHELVDRYLKKHVEIHLSAGLMGDAMSSEVDSLRAQLSQTEDELRKLMNNAGIISLEESKKAYAEQIMSLRQQIFNAQADLSERTTLLQDMSVTPTTPSPATANEPERISSEQITAYQKIAAKIALLQRKEQDLLAYFTESSSRVQEIRSQLVEAEAQKKKLEDDFPALNRIQIAVPGTSAANQPANTFNPQNTAAQIAALKAKIIAYNEQLNQVKTELAKVDSYETAILELRRRKEIEETNYRNISNSLKQSQINDAIGSGRAPNIVPIEAPTPPNQSSSKASKTAAMIAAAGIFGGIAWAFFIELFFDRSVRRTKDVEQSLRLPLFLAIPNLAKGSATHALPSTEIKRLPNSDPSDTSETIIPHEEANILNPYFETLRDRLIAYFESINLRHRPKLIAVTGLGQKSGVSMTAAGLARSLSETGEGNVLLVDMTQKKGEGTTVPFFQGKAIADIDHILESRITTTGENKLFVVSEGSSSEKLSRQLPQRFSQLVPKLKASNFDYIIFDMPPVSQISVTPRLAASMDMVLLVIESEKNDREMAQRAADLLSKANANVGVILNKTKSYIPTALHQDRDSLLGS